MRRPAILGVHGITTGDAAHLLEQLPGGCPVTALARTPPPVIQPPILGVVFPAVSLGVLRDKDLLDELVQLIQIDVRECPFTGRGPAARLKIKIGWLGVSGLTTVDSYGS